MANQYRLLGKFEVEIDEKPSPLMKSTKGLGLLAYLIVTNRTQTRERVSDLLWDVASTQKALKNLRSLLPNMRKWIPELQITRQNVTFTPHAETTVDFLTLQAGINSQDPNRLEEAIYLYKGELLGGFYMPDAPRFNEWLLWEQERLRQQVMDAIYQLAAQHEKNERWQAGIRLARHWIEIDPPNESAHLQLMRFLAGNGQIKSAVAQYDICRQILSEHIGVEPSEELATFQQTLQAQLAQEISLDASFDKNTLPEPGPLPPHSYIPYRRNPNFTGREELMLQLGELFLSNQQRMPPVATVVGMGGLGKTQLAVEFAYRYGRFFSGGVYWLGFGQAENVAEEVARTGGERAMQLFQDSNKLTLTAQIERVQRAWQDPIPRLLIFDNCEDENLLAKWLPTTGGCRVIVTSRRSKWSRELVTTTLLLKTLDRLHSVLFLQKTATHLSQPQADEIASELGDFPLALYLAGEFLHRFKRVMEPENYCQHLREKGTLQHPSLQGKNRDFSPTGHDLHIARTFAHSLDYLDDKNDADQMARRLLARAACFAPAEPIPTQLLAQTVSQDLDDIMSTLLIEEGIIRLRQIGVLLGERENTIILHPLLAEFAVKFLANDTQAQKDVERSIIQQLTKHFESNNMTQTLPFPAVHLQFVATSVVATSAQSRQNTISGKLLMFLGMHLRNLDEYERADHYLQRAITIQQQVLGDNHPDHADSLTRLSMSYFRQGQYELAKPLSEQSLAIQKNAFGWEHAETAKSLTNLGLITVRLTEYESAAHYFEQALTIQEKVLSPLHLDTALTLTGLCQMNSALEKFELAQQYGEKALSIRKQVLGNKPHLTIAQSYNNVGHLYGKMGEHKMAISALLESLKICEDLLGKQHFQIAIIYGNLGVSYRETGQYSEAISYLEQSLAIRKSLFGEAHMITMRIVKDLGGVYWNMGNKEKAREIFAYALPITKNLAPLQSSIYSVYGRAVGLRMCPRYKTFLLSLYI